jgi:hypothetical protein
MKHAFKKRIPRDVSHPSCDLSCPEAFHCVRVATWPLVKDGRIDDFVYGGEQAGFPPAYRG